MTTTLESESKSAFLCHETTTSHESRVTTHDSKAHKQTQTQPPPHTHPPPALLFLIFLLGFVLAAPPCNTVPVQAPKLMCSNTRHLVRAQGCTHACKQPSTGGCGR